MIAATPQTMFRVLAVFLLCGLINAQSVKPINDTSKVGGNVEFVMDVELENLMPVHPPIAPLTDDAGRQGSFRHRQVRARFCKCDQC